MRATPCNYPHKPMPDRRAELHLYRVLTDKQYRALVQGLIPRSQEDRWFAFEDGGWFSMHRSSTGFCIYRVRLEEEGDGWCVAESWVNRDRDQYASDDDAIDAGMLGRLLDSIIASNSK